MNTYLDIGVVRIQSWLARAPHLKGRRGASTMIREATSPDTIRRLIAQFDGAATVNDEVGAVDGVVHLRMATADAAVANRVADAVVRHLRTQLPYAQLRVTHTTGMAYVTGATTAQQDWTAAAFEWPLARPCDWCRSAAAQEPSRSDNDTLLCRECLLRAQHARTSRGRVPPGPERDLLDRLATDRLVPDEFIELARLGPTGDDTHLATIHADGNAVGALLQRLARHDHDQLPGVPRCIQDATWKALVAGVAAIDAGVGMLPVVPHLVGGDDVLVSLPAHGGWDFLAALMTDFSTSLADLGTGEHSAPSLSAGVVFHHYKYPLSAVVDMASDLLVKAKRELAGASAVAWQSVSHDGDQISNRPPVRRNDLVALRPHLQELAAVPAAQRATLAQLIADPDTNTREVDAHLRRVGLETMVRPFKHDAGVDLADALAMVRWWRK